MNGKIVIITGASGGLGRVLSLEFGRAGATVVAHYHANRGSALSVVEEVEAGGGTAVALQADITDSTQVNAMTQQVLDRFGRIDVLVNNAGISRDGISWKLAEEQWSEVLDVNLNGAFLCTRAVLPAMRAQQWGRIVSISSVVGQAGMPGTASYAASKAGLIGMTKTIAREVARKGITVNCLSLGYFSVGLIMTLSAEVREAVVAQIPMGRLGEPGEVAHAVRFLCDERAAYITGQVLNINGGFYM